VLGWTRADVVTRSTEAVPREAAQLFWEAVEQRSRRRPLQHLTGTQAFWRHELIVTPDVLVPRPETELLVETALDKLRDLAAPVIVDVGTGSGCIALALAAERPDAEVHATDLSPAALRVARGNAARLGLESRVEFHEGDLLQPMATHAGSVDLVVSNPPYVTDEEWTRLEPEVRDHDPRMALVPPEGVSSVYARLARGAAAVVRGGGWLLVEIGAGLDRVVADRMASEGFTDVFVRADLRGIGRLVGGRRAI
jgi:release factor glutamine methyltransferase